MTDEALAFLKAVWQRARRAKTTTLGFEAWLAQDGIMKSAEQPNHGIDDPRVFPKVYLSQIDGSRFEGTSPGSFREPMLHPLVQVDKPRRRGHSKPRARDERGRFLPKAQLDKAA